LPVVFGVLALFLFAWQHENDRVIASIGMGWDMGPPVWPYRAVPSFSYAVNAPAYVVSWPILKLLNLQTPSFQYAVWFPAILILWWWVGTYLDFGLLGPNSRSWRRLKAALLLLSSAVLVFVAFRVCLDKYFWARDHCSNSPSICAIVLLGGMGLTLWFLFFATAFARAAIRLARVELRQFRFNPTTYRGYLLCAAILGANAAVISYLDRVITPLPDPNHCETDRLHRLGCVHGTVVDEKGAAAHVEVDLAPAFKSGDARRLGTKSEWTDRQGRYNFNWLDAGEYILAVNPFESSPGPSKETPYETRYYAQADDESGAEHVVVTQPLATSLAPFQLHSSKFAAIEVIVEWEDGSRPKRSGIFLLNSRYWGVIGGFDEIEDGAGKIELAQGFEYVANADVKCAGRGAWEQRLAVPSKQFKGAEGQTPTNLRLVLIGSPCVLSEPP